MERIDPSLYSVINSSLKTVSAEKRKVEQKYYDVFLKWPDNKKEFIDLPEEQALAYRILCHTFDAICFVINDTLITYGDKAYNKKITEWRFKLLEDALTAFRHHYDAGLFDKADALNLFDDFIATFDKDTLVYIGENYIAADKMKWSEVIKVEMGLIHDESIFNRIYLMLKNFRDKL